MPRTLEQHQKNAARICFVEGSGHVTLGWNRQEKEVAITRKSNKSGRAAMVGRIVDGYLREMMDSLLNPTLRDTTLAEVDLNPMRDYIKPLTESQELPEISVFTTCGEDENPEELIRDLEPLFQRISDEQESGRLIIVFADETPSNIPVVERLFADFPGARAKVDISFRLETLKDTLTESLLKAAADWNDAPTPRRTLLDEARRNLLAITSLYSEKRKGCLCGKRVADFFGLKYKEMAELLNKSTTAFSATPDALDIQDTLKHFERIARLRTVMDEPQFHAWFGAENWGLENQSPRRCILNGDFEVVADLATRILSGNPS